MSNKIAAQVREMLLKPREDEDRAQKACREVAHDDIVSLRNNRMRAGLLAASMLGDIRERRLLEDYALVADVFVSFVLLNPDCVSEMLTGILAQIENDKGFSTAAEGLVIAFLEVCILIDRIDERVLIALGNTPMCQCLSSNGLSKEGAGRLTSAITSYVRRVWTSDWVSSEIAPLRLHYFLLRMKPFVEKKIEELCLTSQQVRSTNNLLIAFVREMTDRIYLEMPLGRALEMNRAFTEASEPPEAAEMKRKFQGELLR